MTRHAAVYLQDAYVGTLSRQRTGTLALEFAPRWQASGSGVPLSLSLPRTQRLHQGDAVEFFFGALLPDHGDVRARWGREHDIDGGDTLALLRAVGADLPGAVQVVPIDAPLGGSAGRIRWLEMDDLESALRELQRDETAWHTLGEGSFSLGGAQRKIALLRSGVRWGQPLRRRPSTHIVKPGLGLAYPGHAEVEHFCLRLAHKVGLRAAQSELCHFGDETAVAVQRFDRISKGRSVRVCSRWSMVDGRWSVFHGPSSGRSCGIPRRRSRLFCFAVAVRYCYSLLPFAVAVRRCRSPNA